MICTAASRSASFWRKNTATHTNVTTSINAACTGLRMSTTPSALASASPANTKKMTASIPTASLGCARSRRHLRPCPSVMTAVLFVACADGVLRRGREVSERELAGLAPLGWPYSEAELARPADAPFVARVAGGSRGAHPRAGVVVFVSQPQLPRLPAGAAVVADDELGLCVDRVPAGGGREIGQLCLGGRPRRGGLGTEGAVGGAGGGGLV